MYPPFFAVPFLAPAVGVHDCAGLLYPIRPKASPGGKEAKMEFTYKSATGNITIDVDEHWVNILKDLDQEEENNNLRERRRHYHFEACDFEGEAFAAEDQALERLLEMEEARRMVKPALRKLTPSQKKLISALYYEGLSAREYAASQGLDEATVSLTKKAALKKIKKFL